MKNKRKTTALAIDTRGNRWKWNCGWYIVDESGEPKRTRAKPIKKWAGLPRLDNGIWKEPGFSGSKQRPDQRQQPLSHTQFRKAVKLLDPTDRKQREVLHGLDRPGRAWRRYVHREVMSHNLFGSVYLLASDGCHAIIETQDGDHEKVCFENLSEKIGVPLSPRSKAVKDAVSNEKKKAVVNSLIAKYMAKQLPTNN